MFSQWTSLDGQPGKDRPACGVHYSEHRHRIGWDEDREDLTDFL